MYTQIVRDSFARTTVIREVTGTQGTCDWCGQHRTAKRAGRDRVILNLFRYGHQSDGGRTGWSKGGFCCKGCHDVYHS